MPTGLRDNFPTCDTDRTQSRDGSLVVAQSGKGNYLRAIGGNFLGVGNILSMMISQVITTAELIKLNS